MAEVNQQNFEHNILEADIERLSKEIAEKRNLLEHKNLSERELIKKSLEPMIREQPSVSGQQSDVSGQLSDVNSKILPNYLKNSPPEIIFIVKELVNSLFHQGIEKVIKRAHRANPFILDAFHDALTDKLYEELKKRKLI